MELPKRKPTRLRVYDYSSPGGYFVTICTVNKEKILSGIIVGDGVLDVPKNRLTCYGEVADKYIRQMNEIYHNISVDKYVIMPNHVHLLLQISEGNGSSGTPTPTMLGNVSGGNGSSGTPTPTMLGNVSGGNGSSNRANSVIALFVSAFKRFCNREYGKNIWQRSFHDHIIRGWKDYEEIWKYIDTNPARWEDDCFYTK